MIKCPVCFCFTLQADQHGPGSQCTNCGYFPSPAEKPKTAAVEMLDVYELLFVLFNDMKISLALYQEDGRSWESALDAVLDGALTKLNDKIMEVADAVSEN